MHTRKFTREISVALVSTSSSPPFDISEYSAGEVMIPTGSTITTLTYYHMSATGDFYASQDASGAAVTQTVAADKSYPIPATVMGGAKLQIRSNNAGSVVIDLKS